MELNWDQKSGVCKDSHFVTVSRLRWKASHNLMCLQGSEQGGLEDPSTDWYSLRWALRHSWLLSHLCSQLTKVWEVMAANGIRNCGSALAKALGWTWPILVSGNPTSRHSPNLPGLFILLAMIRHLFWWAQEPGCYF